MLNLKCFTLLIILINLIVIIVSDNNKIEKIDIIDGINNNPDDLKNFKCFDKHETDEYRNIFNSGHKDPIGIQVSDRITHQLISRIFGIYLREILGYQNVYLSPIKLNGKYKSDEKYKLYETLNSLVQQWPIPKIDLEVWMHPDYHAIPSVINEAGLSLDPGRFGWFVPKKFINQWPQNDTNYYQRLHFSVFTDPKSKFYQNYIIDENILNEMESKFGKFRQLIPDQCKNITCVTLLAEYDKDTSFIEYHLNDEIEFQFYVKVIWLEQNFRNAIEWLYDKYNLNELKKLNKNFILLHWTPSDIIDADIEYDIITMPKCELMSSSTYTLCKYEMIPILKYYDKKFQQFRNGFHTLFEFYLSRDILRKLLIKSNLARKSSLNNNDMKLKLNQISCEWLKLNKNKYTNSIEMNQVNITIGGIFPYSGAGRAYGDILSVVDRAIQSINDNKYILPGYSLSVSKNDGACRSDTVMKAFIHYCSMVETPVIGVLGPACSETVEPIAGISKHTQMTVISYSAEGALFTDRETYPYFFRTIGSNRQYEKVYLNLFKQLKWRRVAALTEDGQKYTEYLSHMETMMKLENMELIVNKKFTKDVTKLGMRRLLLELKNIQAKIIIADIYNDNAQLVMCEAYQLQMTAKYGYVWFLPVWLSKTWMIESNNKQNFNCTQEQLYEAINGHFSLIHAPFAPNTSILDYQNNKTVGDLLKEFDNTEISNYAGFLYDAIWVYALGIDKLLRNDPTSINSLRSQKIAQKFVNIIWQTDFNGLSGRIRFDDGGSRINDINILQWINNQFYEIGKYIPIAIKDKLNINVKINGGNFILNESLIHWFSKERPTDGTFICQLAILAEFLNTTCDNVIIYLTSLICLILVALISLASFMFWKHQYHTKIKRTAKVMRNFGIDLLGPNVPTVNTLDKWEVPKDKIVINRRLGEGAFGTVYGGEAQLSDSGWTAVAVKTLKIGASQEDRLDFLSEAEAMKRFDHKNIVQFLGVCLQTEPIYTIMEFMLYGDLKTYLLARRHLVNEKITDDSDISPKRLTMYALDVVRGLSYLADEKYVHRDIACRNCLVNAQRVVKIGDFGMARALYENDYYRFNRKGMLPVRWMAPESLGLGLFTPSSDVWSFGILLYEIITFGSFPYQGLTNYEALEHINRGETLRIPPGTKPHLEALMKACWSQEEKKRPSASEIAEYISNNPRLLTACLDVPISSVQMAETDSDQLEILPGLRKRIATQTDLDLLTRASHINNFDQHNDNNDTSSQRIILQTANIPFIELLNTTNNPDISIDRSSSTSIPPDTNSNDESNINSYSVMSPLLRMDPEIRISNLSLQRYLPMYGVKKQNKLINNTDNCSINLVNNGDNLINKNKHNETDDIESPRETVSIF